MCVAVHNMSSMDDFFLANPIILNEGSCSYIVILLSIQSSMCVAIHNMSSMNEFFLANPIILRCGLDRDYSVYVLGETRFSFFFFLFLCTRFSWGTKVTVHTVRLLFKHCFVLFTHFSVTFLLKMGSMILFTHLKIILLQCFQFSAKISCIQTDPL